jgi:heat shock protein HtpX
MVTLTLIQGVVNTFVVFFARVIGSIVDKTVFRTERGQGPGLLITVIVAQIVLGILASMIVAYFRGGANSAPTQARRSIWVAHADGQRVDASRRPRARRASAVDERIRHHRQGGVMALFATHPPIEARIAALAGRQ